MPITLKRGGPFLLIETQENAFHAYRPGDTIIGDVIRKARFVSPQVKVTIRLYGRAKTKIVSGGGQNKHTYRSRCNLLSGNRQGLFQQIYEGPVHVPPDGDPVKWSFAITIPKHPDAAGLVHQRATYLPVTKEDIAQQPLPSSYRVDDVGFSEQMEGFVEYYLQADMRREGHSDVDTAILPITIHRSGSTHLLPDFVVRTQNYRRTVSTLRLFPGMETAELSFKQKTKTLFGSSSIPHFGFDVKISAPSVIQLKHPTLLPFKIAAVPTPARISDGVRDLSENVMLSHLELGIEICTRVGCPNESIFSTDGRKEDNSTVYNDLYIPALLNRLSGGKDIQIPCGPDPEPLDIGEHLELRLDRTHVYAFGSRIRQKGYRYTPLEPTFTTYNAVRTYALKWKIAITIAGEKTEIEAKMPIKIVDEIDETTAMLNDAPPPPFTKEDAGGYSTGQAGGDDLPTYKEAIVAESSSAGASSSNEPPPAFRDEKSGQLT